MVCVVPSRERLRNHMAFPGISSSYYIKRTSLLSPHSQLFWHLHGDTYPPVLLYLSLSIPGVTSLTQPPAASQSKEVRSPKCISLPLRSFPFLPRRLRKHQWPAHLRRQAKKPLGRYHI